VSRTTKTVLWLLVAVVAIGALLIPRLQSSRTDAAVAVAEVQPLEVETLIVQPHRLVERFSTVGTVRADEWVEIRSEISGILEKVSFDEGALVRKGQVLVQIDDDQLLAERDRAKYRVELAEVTEARQQSLLDQGLTSQEEYDLSLGQLNVLRSELRLAEARLDKTQVRAPFSGAIGLRAVSRGAALTPQMRIATLQKIDTVKLEFSIPESYARSLEIGGSVGFRIKGSPGAFEGTIYAIEPTVDRETRSLRARARCPNPDGALLPGAFADVELAVNTIEDALTVPSLAVIPELGSKKVFVVEDGMAQPRLIETGVRSESEVQIIRGLEPGDRVIVSAIQQLHSGVPVEEKAADGVRND
jgi:membrane fusion protein (multidrug efflux system)